MKPNPDFEREVLAMLRPEVVRPDVGNPTVEMPQVSRPQEIIQSLLNPPAPVERPQEREDQVPREPMLRSTIDKVLQLGTMGIGAAAAVPLAISQVQFKPVIREVQ